MFDSFLHSEFTRLGLPGLAVVISQHGQEQFAAGYGHCDPARQKPITADTQFGVASVTKLLTAIQVLQLQDQNRLSVNDPVNQYYPDLNIASDTRMQLRHLLSHSAGLPGLPSRFHSVNRQNESDSSGGTDAIGPVSIDSNLPANTRLLNATDLPGFINKLNPVPLASPGELLSYSNESFCLLGGIIEKLTAEPYQQRVENSIFKRLDMLNSVVGSTAHSSDNIALPLVRKDAEFEQAGIWDAPLFYPAGGMMSSARDLTRLLGVLSNNSGFLSADSRQALLCPVISVASRPDTSIGYGYGLEYQLLDSDTALHWHTGQRTGISSFVAWVSGTDIAISVLSHIANAPVAHIGFELVAKLLQRSDVVWPQLSYKIVAKPLIPVLDDLDRMQGRYSTAEGFDFRVDRTASTLFLRANDHLPPIPFRFIDRQCGIVGPHNFRFLMRDADDKQPWALALDLRILPQSFNE